MIDEVEQPSLDTYKTEKIELIEVEVPTGIPVEPEVAQADDEFDFPLFSFGVEDKTEAAVNVSEEQPPEDGNGAKLMRVSLREPVYETLNQERPKSYYFASYSQDDRSRFAQSALDYETILRDGSLGPNQGWKRFRGTVIDVKQYNERVEKSLEREKRLKKRKPGKKQRLARKLGQQHEIEREQKSKEIKKLLKKKFHKRGGKKNKKKPEPAPPKFRTE